MNQPEPSETSQSIFQSRVYLDDTPLKVGSAQPIQPYVVAISEIC